MWFHLIIRLFSQPHHMCAPGILNMAGGPEIGHNPCRIP